MILLCTLTALVGAADATPKLIEGEALAKQLSVLNPDQPLQGPTQVEALSKGLDRWKVLLKEGIVNWPQWTYRLMVVRWPLPELPGAQRGQDQFGTYADLPFPNGSQRFRLIIPGTFTMGIPTSEQDRSPDEVQHQVTLNRGTWLAASSCTQALWQAVTGKNLRTSRETLIVRRRMSRGTTAGCFGAFTLAYFWRSGASADRGGMGVCMQGWNDDVVLGSEPGCVGMVLR